jgi:hypothetical protein
VFTDLTLLRLEVLLDFFIFFIFVVGVARGLPSSDVVEDDFRLFKRRCSIIN